MILFQILRALIVAILFTVVLIITISFGALILVFACLSPDNMMSVGVGAFVLVLFGVLPLQRARRRRKQLHHC